MSDPEFSLEAPFDFPIFARSLRAAFANQTPACLSLPSAFSLESCESLRNFLQPHLQAHDVPDRGRYRALELITNEGEAPLLTMNVAMLLAALREFASEVSGKHLRQGPTRFIWFSPGDYSLRFDDAKLRPKADFLEATLDLSSEPADEPVTVYTEMPLAHAAIAQLPGQLTLIARGQHSYRFDRYRNCLLGDRAFILLRAQFPLAES